MLCTHSEVPAACPPHVFNHLPLVLQPASYPQDAPINLTKSLTIGTANYSQRGYTVLETEYLASRVVLAPNVTLTLQDIALGRARKTSGQGIPFFTGAQQVFRGAKVACSSTGGSVCSCSRAPALPQCLHVSRKEGWKDGRMEKRKEKHTKAFPSAWYMLLSLESAPQGCKLQPATACSATTGGL